MTVQDPSSLPDMAAVRAEIDQLDDAILALLARRQACVDRAAVVKPAEGIPANAPARVTEVLARVRAKAEEAGFEPKTAEAMWQTMIEAMIAREERAMGRKD